MKAKVVEREEDSNPVGAGIECPSCGNDMRKVITVEINARLKDGDQHDVESSPSETAFQCDGCGYREEAS